MKTGKPRDALAPYPWSGSVNWCLTGANETEISAALWALWLGKDFTFFICSSFVNISHQSMCFLGLKAHITEQDTGRGRQTDKQKRTQKLLHKNLHTTTHRESRQTQPAVNCVQCMERKYNSSNYYLYMKSNYLRTIFRCYA